MNRRTTRAGAASRSGDGEARGRIVRDLDRTFLVEAGAGSGKTRSLVDRMVALIAAGRTPIQNMAAVTFTRKAAAELRGRFQLALEQSLRPACRTWTGQEKERLADALGALEQGFVGTIHSFCASLIRERPVEIGIDPEFEELEELEDGVFRAECWHEFLADIRIAGEEVLADLDAVGLAPTELRDPFEAVFPYPEVRPAGGRDAPPDFVPVRSGLESFLAAAEAAVPAARPEKGFDALQTLLRRLALRRRNLDFSDRRVLMETLELFEKNPGVTKNRWRSREEAEEILAAFEDFKRTVAAPALREWREFRHPKVLNFLGMAASFYEKKRREMSLLNFQDQLLLASELLREHPEVRRYFRERYRCLLVDEFQDTDPIQAEILFYLSGSDAAERDWTRLVPEPGSLFLVGDPKQSIYRFRRADIDIYNLVKERILATGGEVLELTANYRSLGCIADWANPLFRSHFPAATDVHQARFAELRTERRECEEAARGVFKITVPKKERNREKDIAADDAARVAEFIAGAVDDGDGRLILSAKKESGERDAPNKDGESQEEFLRPARPGDFLVLFRYKKNMGIYARELERHGLPFEISGSEAFSESAEIGEIVTLLRALKDPGNPVLTAAVLRGLFFGASDQELLDFRSAGGSFAYAGEGPSEAAPPGKVRRALLTMREWWEWSGEAPPSVVMEWILERSGLLGALVSSEMGSSRAGNVLKLVEVVRARERDGMTSFAAVAEFVGTWVEEQALEEMSLTPGRQNAVRLMNLHKAKGLEAPVVILANPVGIRDHEPTKHIVRTAGGGTRLSLPEGEGPPGPAGYFLFQRQAGWQKFAISQPARWEEMSDEEKRYEEAEEKRLMYVAATRAKDILVVSTYEEDLGARKAWSVLGGALADVPELGEALPEAGCGAGEEEGSEMDGLGREVLKLGKGEVTRARAEILRRKGDASRAGYLVDSVTSLARSGRPPADWAAGGLGMSWGTAVHGLLSVLGRRWPGMRPEERGPGQLSGWLLPLARNALVAAGRDPGEERTLADLVGSIAASEFWERAMDAEARFFEVPFSIVVRSGDPEYGGLAGQAAMLPVVAGQPVAAVKDAPLFLGGAIDLVFKDKRGWVIADYKTDALPAVAGGRGAGAAARKALDALVARYTPQVALYARFWEKITEEKVVEAGLYFTSIGFWERIL